MLGIGFLLWYAFAPRAKQPERNARPSHSSIALQHPVDGDGSPISEPDSGRFTAVLYSYSVIPGGVQSIAELRSVLARDPIVAAHYAGFDLTRARLIRLGRERAAYVSYRLDDHIFWTSHKLTLRKGETVITDGDHTARTRCGNLVSDVPFGPMSPREPPPQIFDTPVPLDMPFGPGIKFELPPTPEWILEPPTIGTTAPIPGWGLYFPFFPLGGNGPPLPVVPSVPTPEARTLVLFLLGLALILLFRKVLHKFRKSRGFSIASPRNPGL
jgi:hypothetical protein